MNLLIIIPLTLKKNFFKVVFIYLFIYIEREREEGRERGKETSMCERNIEQVPLTCPQMGTWPATQACALD